MLRLLRMLPLVIVGLALASTAGAQSFQTTCLCGVYEVPPNQSPAFGHGDFTLDPSSMLHYDITFGGLSAPETAAHIHGPAVPGQTAGVLYPLPFGSPKVGTIGPLTAEQIQWLHTGVLYVNIHSSAFPDGEIRGHICPSGTATEESTWGSVKNLYR